jgi:hypothetical protein
MAIRILLPIGVFVIVVVKVSFSRKFDLEPV